MLLNRVQTLNQKKKTKPSIATGRAQNIDQCQLICAAGTKINLLRENSPKGRESVSKP